MSSIYHVGDSASIIFFSLGFLFALHMKELSQNSLFGGFKMLLPLFIGTLLFCPSFLDFPLLEVPFIAFGTGMMMLTVYGEFD